MKRCPICAELIDDQSTVCPFCGEQLQSAPPPPVPPSNEADTKPSQKECPICGEMIDTHLSVCPICGEYIGAPQPVVTPKPEPVAVPKPAPVVVPPPQPELEPEPIMPEPEPVFVTTRKPESEPEPIMPEPEPVFVTTRKPEPEPEPIMLEPEPVVAPKPEPAPVVEPKPAPTPEPEVKSAGTPIPPITPTPRSSYQEEPPRKNNLLKYILGLLALLLIACIGALCYLFFFKGDKPNEPQKDIATKQDTPSDPSSATGVMSTEEILDSVANDLADDVGLVAIYPDEDRACLYYIFNGELYKYSASNNETETLTIPVDEETDAVMNAEKEDDDTYLRIDMGDKNMKHTAYYRLNTQTGSLIRVKENTASTFNNPEPAPAPNPNRQRPDDMPPPPDGRGPGSRGYREPRTIDGQRPDRPRRGWRDDDRQAPQRDENVAPPNSNSSGFHLEPANGQSGRNNQSGNNNGIRFQKVNRIPNQ